MVITRFLVSENNNRCIVAILIVELINLKNYFFFAIIYQIILIVFSLYKICASVINQLYLIHKYIATQV